MTKEMMNGVLGNAIRTARLEKRMSQEELAEMVGITPTHLKHIESEHRKPSVDVLYKIVTTLTMSLDSVFLPPKAADSDMYKKAVLLLGQCNQLQLKVSCATIEAMLSDNNG